MEDLMPWNSCLRNARSSAGAAFVRRSPGSFFSSSCEARPGLDSDQPRLRRLRQHEEREPLRGEGFPDRVEHVRQRGVRVGELAGIDPAFLRYVRQLALCPY